MSARRTPAQVPRSGEASGGLRGRPLRIARMAWIALAAVILGLNAASIPYVYAKFSAICIGARCAEMDLLTPEDARSLAEFGITPEFYAAYWGAGLPNLITLVFFALAALIFFRGPRSVMALFSAFMLLLFGGVAISGTMRELVDVYPALWFPVHFLDYLGQVSFGVFFYVFPTGRFVPRWTRWLAAAYAVFFVFDVFFPDLAPEVLLNSLFLTFVGSLVGVQIYRYRRVYDEQQRRQTRWVVFGFALAVGGLAAMIAVGIASGLTEGLTTALGRMIVQTIFTVLMLLIPASIVMAILYSRLYDIDRLVNRTLVYGTLTTTLALTYLGGIAGLQYLFRALTGQTEQRQLVIVATILLIAALFNPLRRRIQNTIDRRFYRKKYDAAKTLEAFSAKLRDETDLEALNNELLAVVRDTMQPEHVSLWLREPGGGAPNESANEREA